MTHTTRWTWALFGSLALCAPGCGKGTIAETTVVAPPRMAEPRPEPVRPDPPQMLPGFSLDQVSFVIEVGDVIGLEVRTRDVREVEELALDGAPRMKSAAGVEPVLVESAMREDKMGWVPAEGRAMLGRTVRLYKGARVACEGTVTRYAVVGQAFPSDSEWWHDDDGNAYSTTELAKRAWGFASLHLVAVVERTQGSCSGAQWARAAELPEPQFAPMQSLDAAALSDLRRQFRAFEGYADAQSTWDAQSAPSPAPQQAPSTPSAPATNSAAPPTVPWDTTNGASFAIPVSDGAAFVAYFGASFDFGCGAQAAMHGAWRLEGGPGHWKSTLIESGIGDQPPKVVVDLNGDGQWEGLYFDDTATHLGPWPATESGMFHSLTIPDPRCPC